MRSLILIFTAILAVSQPVYAQSDTPEGASINMAPVIGELPIPVIADLPGVTDANHFVFEDAFDLATLVTDDFTTDGAINWSYEVVGTQLYSINNAQPLGGASNPLAPTTSESLLLNLDPADGDLDAMTVTLRDISFSPIGGPNVDPGASGIVNSQVVTFWASDGTTATSASTIFYTDNDGIDRFSDGFEPIVSLNFEGNSNGWTPEAPISGSMTATAGANGLCLTAVLSDVAIGGFASDAAVPFDLIDNAVYRMTMSMSTTAALGATPILQFVANNTAGTMNDGFAYGGEFFIIDAEGGANAISTRANGEYTWVFTPAQVSVSNWRSTSGGAFDPANDAINDFRVEMNVFDIDGIGNAESRAGTICLTDMRVDRADLANFTDSPSVFSIASGNFNATNFGIANSVFVTSETMLSRSFSGGNLVVQASTTTLGLMSLEPGSAPYVADTAHYPIAVVENQLYRVEWTAAASAGFYPIEIIRLNADTPTFEIIQNGYAAASGSGLGLAALPTGGGTAETYTLFYYTHNSTLSSGMPANWRPSLTVAMREDVNTAVAADTSLTFSDVNVYPTSANGASAN